MALLCNHCLQINSAKTKMVSKFVFCFKPYKPDNKGEESMLEIKDSVAVITGGASE